MDPRANLAAAIRDYSQWAHGRSGQEPLLERLEEIRRDVEQAPSPVSQGPGSVPSWKPGSGGQREAPNFPAREALAAMMEGAMSSE
jgi:hypothetical protein